jgi:hypothetical protein
MNVGPTCTGCPFFSNVSSAERRKEEACSNREGDTVSGKDDERFAPEVVNAKEISGTACNQ